MSSTSLIAVRDDSPMSKNSGPGPRAGGPIARRSFTPAQKLDHLAAYEDAILRNEGGAYLREQGVYSSQITEWRKLRDAGVLEGKRPGEKIGRLTAEQAEIARLRRQLAKAEQRLATTEVALTIMGKAHELLEQLSKSSRDEPPHTRS
jgi:transposase-like protein